MTQSTPPIHSSQKNNAPAQKKQGMKNGKVQKIWHKKLIVACVWLAGMGAIVLMGAVLWQYYEEETKETRDIPMLKTEEQDLDARAQKLVEKKNMIIKTGLETIEKEFTRTQAEMAALNARLNTLERDMQANNMFIAETAAFLKQAQGTSQQNTQGISLDAEEIRRLEGRIGAVERLVSLKRQNEQKGFEKIQMLTRIREAVYRGQTFEDALNILIQEVGQNDQQIQDLLSHLKSFSITGLLTPTDLYLSFPDLADKISMVMRPDPQTLSEKVLSSVQDLVSIRSIDADVIQTGSLDGTLLKMERVLAHGDLRKALEIIKGLNPKAQKVAASWIQNARDYLEVESILNTIETFIVRGSFEVSTELGSREKTNDHPESSQ